MKPLIFSISLALLGLAGCEHYGSEAEPRSVLVDPAMEQFAIAQVYEAHPTRALVDKVDSVASTSENTVLRIEMTGSATARKIYELTISEPSPGTYELESIETVQ